MRTVVTRLEQKRFGEALINCCGARWRPSTSLRYAQGEREKSPKNRRESPKTVRPEPFDKGQDTLREAKSKGADDQSFLGRKTAALALAAASWPAVLYGHGGHAEEPLPFDALVLVFGMIPWNFRVDILLVLVLAVAVYLTGWSRLRRQADGAATLSGLALYLAGIAALFTALVSPVDRLAAERLSMHMVQHILLLMIAPLGILLANPFAAVVWGLPAVIRERFAALFRDGAPLRSALSVLTLMPVAWTLYVVNLWGWHHPALYQAALEYWWLHDLEHWLFFGTAVLFWWPIVNAAPLYRPTRPLGARVVYLVAATLQNTLLGMAISLPERVLYPFYAAVPVLEKLSPIQDQALGGGIMWVSGHMYIVPILVLIARRLIAEDEAVNAAGEGGDGGLGTVPRHG